MSVSSDSSFQLYSPNDIQQFLPTISISRGISKKPRDLSPHLRKEPTSLTRTTVSTLNTPPEYLFEKQNCVVHDRRKELSCLVEASESSFLGKNISNLLEEMESSSKPLNYQYKLPYIEEDQDLISVVEILAKHQIVSAPIVVRSQTSTEVSSKTKEHYVGTIGILDLVALCCSLCSTEDGLNQHLSQSDQYSSLERMCQCYREKFQQTTVKEVLALDKVGCMSWRSIDLECPISDLVSMMTLPEVVRIAVTKTIENSANASEEVIAIVNVFDVAKYLYRHISEMDPNTAYSPLLSWFSVLHFDYKADADSWPDEYKKEYIISAFRAIWDKQTAGEVQAHGTSYMDKFLNWMMQISMADLTNCDFQASISAAQTLSNILDLFCKRQVLRVFVRNDSKVAGVIRLCDLFAIILQQQQQNQKLESVKINSFQ
jgi:CBS domain-containing protein